MKQKTNHHDFVAKLIEAVNRKDKGTKFSTINAIREIKIYRNRVRISNNLQE